MAMRELEFVDQHKIRTEWKPDCTVHTILEPNPNPRLRRIEKIQTWSRVQELGQGGFGIVYLEKESRGELRAVKRVRKSTTRQDDHDSLRELFSVAVFSKNTANFPAFFGWFEDLSHIYIAMEYFPLGDLRQCISGLHRLLSENEVQMICYQIALALEAIHERSITHRDLKPNNIFVVEQGPEWHVKVGDFGISKHVRNQVTAMHTIFLGPFVAPEIRKLVEAGDDDVLIYTPAVDIWSLGALAYWLITQNNPFPGQLARRYQRTGEIPEEMITMLNLSQEGLDFIRSCLKLEPENRPSASSLFGLSWLGEADTSSRHLRETTNHPGEKHPSFHPDCSQKFTRPDDVRQHVRKKQPDLELPLSKRKGRPPKTNNTQRGPSSDEKSSHSGFPMQNVSGSEITTSEPPLQHNTSTPTVQARASSHTGETNAQDTLTKLPSVKCDNSFEEVFDQTDALGPSVALPQWPKALPVTTLTLGPNPSTQVSTYDYSVAPPQALCGPKELMVERVFETEAHLYEYDCVGCENRYRGFGLVNLQKEKANGRVRIYMRDAATKKVIANHYITKDITFFQRNSDKTYTWSTYADYSDVKPKACCLFLRFVHSVDCIRFVTILLEYSKITFLDSYAFSSWFF